MALIKSIEEIQQVMQVSNLDLDNSIPDMDTPMETRLLPYLGSDFVNALQTVYDNANYPDNANAAEKAIILAIQRPLAHFAYVDNLGTIHARLTSAGVRRMTTDDMPSVYRWEYEELKTVLLEKAYSSLESMLLFLERNQENYPVWQDGEGLKKRRALLIKSGIDFSEYFHLHQSCRTYHLLIGCMKDVDVLHIIPMLGADFYNSLRQAETSTMSAEQAELIDRLKYAIANLAIAQACDKLPVRIDENGFTVLSGFGDGKNNDKINAAGAAMSTLRNKALSDGNKYLARARRYLNDNASATVFPEFFASEYYRDPAKVANPRGNDRRNIFRF